MTHPRARIREAILQRLKTPGAGGEFRTAARERVFKSRLVPIDVNDDEELPAILIYARDDSRNIEHDYGPDGEDSFVRSHLAVVVEAIVRGGTTVDDKLDAMAEQIEAALDDWEIPGFEGATMLLSDTDIDVIAEGTKHPLGAIGLVWNVCYSRVWRPRAPGTRPHTINVSIAGDEPERIITNDRGIYNEPRIGPAQQIDDFVAGVPTFLGRGLR